MSSSNFQTWSKNASGMEPTIKPSNVAAGAANGSVAVTIHSPDERDFTGTPHSSPEPGLSRWRMK